MAVADDHLPAAPVDQRSHRRRACDGSCVEARSRRARMSACAARSASCRSSSRPWRANSSTAAARVTGPAAQTRTCAARYSASRHPQLDAEALRKPAGQAEVIGVEVRDDDALYRQSRKGRCRQIWSHRPRVTSELSPVSTSVQPGAVAQHPEIDVIERERQRHAQPEHAGSDLRAMCPARADGRTETPAPKGSREKRLLQVEDRSSRDIRAMRGRHGIDP